MFDGFLCILHRNEQNKQIINVIVGSLCLCCLLFCTFAQFSTKLHCIVSHRRATRGCRHQHAGCHYVAALHCCHSKSAFYVIYCCLLFVCYSTLWRRYSNSIQPASRGVSWHLACVRVQDLLLKKKNEPLLFWLLARPDRIAKCAQPRTILASLQIKYMHSNWNWARAQFLDSCILNIFFLF